MYNYETIFYHSMPFYRFTLNKKFIGFIPAGIEIDFKGKSYGTIGILTRIADLWKAGRFPGEIMKQKKTIKEWLTKHDNVNKRDFIAFAKQIESYV